MKTNRDLYKSISNLINQKKDVSIPSLEVYLKNLLLRASQVAHKEALDLEEFFFLLRDSFDDPGTFTKEATPKIDLPSFQKWKTILSEQIEDLREMEENNQLEDPERYFGIDAPSGRRWYNFDPCTYIECGVTGTFGGWVEGDETGRIYVPGKVVVFEHGKVTSADPRELPNPIVEIPQITWERFRVFLWNGRAFE